MGSISAAYDVLIRPVLPGQKVGFWTVVTVMIVIYPVQMDQVPVGQNSVKPHKKYGHRIA